MKLKISFDEPLSEAVDLDVLHKSRRAGVREDRRTGQFVPTVDGKDVSPTSFDEARALDIAEQTIEHETRRQRALLELALVALGDGDTDTVEEAINAMTP